MVNLEAPYDLRLSPDGSHAVIVVRTVNWRDNRYESICLVHAVQNGQTWQLTQAGSVNQAEWLDNES